MQRLSKSRLQAIITDALALKDPEFHLSRSGARWSGPVISPTFRGKGDSERQQMIWDALDHELGPDSVKLVGMLLAYTPDEWNLDRRATA